MIGLDKSLVTVYPYDPTWVDEYEKEIYFLLIIFIAYYASCFNFYKQLFKSLG